MTILKPPKGQRMTRRAFMDKIVRLVCIGHGIKGNAPRWSSLRSWIKIRTWLIERGMPEHGLNDIISIYRELRR